MKRRPSALLICILSACLILMTGCSPHNKNTAENTVQDNPAGSFSDPSENSSINDVAAQPAMTPVIVEDAPPEISADTDEDLPDEIPLAASEAASETGSDENTVSDAEQREPEEEPESAAGIFTSSEISEEIKLRINGKSYADGCTIPYEDLRYLQLSYVDFNGNTQLGEMICNKAIAADLIEIFSELYHSGYQIDKIRLIDDYNADDDASCDDDNTSCFCYRVVAGSTNLSKHAQGVAVDINPFYNPYVTYPNGKIRISPVGSEAYADRSSDFPHKIDENDLAYKLFTKHGFTWGGHWKTLKDYQHFQKPL